jgi:sulfur transfer complex TusBCD TusB component (DsrH family)
MSNKIYLISFLFFASFVTSKDYYVITNVTSSLNSIIVNAASKSILSGNQTKTLTDEDLIACVEENTCIEKVMALDQRAYLLKIDLIADQQNELFITLIDLENKMIESSEMLPCYDCSTLELLGELSSFKLGNNYTSPSLVKKSLGFQYKKTEALDDIITLDLISNPPSAIFIDNENIGTSPLQISAEKKTQINVSFIDINHKKLNKKIKFDKNKILNFDLVPIQGSLYLTSSPSRANIFIDGKSFGKTPKEIKKIKLTDSIKITLKLDNFIDQEILFRPQSEKRENQNIKLERGQGFLKIMHDGDSEKIIVYSNNILLGKLSKYRNDTIVLDAGKNEIKLIQGDVKKEKNFKIIIDEFEDWDVTFVESVDINISF